MLSDIAEARWRQCQDERYRSQMMVVCKTVYDLVASFMWEPR